jgi:hypothetical protein
MRLRARRHLVIVCVATLLALTCAACGPEDGRPRGGGAGADGGNKPATVVPKSKVFSAEHP